MAKKWKMLPPELKHQTINRIFKSLKMISFIMLKLLRSRAKMLRMRNYSINRTTRKIKTMMNPMKIMLMDQINQIVMMMVKRKGNLPEFEKDRVQEGPTIRYDFPHISFPIIKRNHLQISLKILE